MSGPNMIYVLFAESGSHNIQRWSREPFDGATVFANAGNGAPLQQGDTNGYPVEHLPMALRGVASNLYVECAQHVTEDMVRIVTQAAELIESAAAPAGDDVGRLRAALQAFDNALGMCEDANARTLGKPHMPKDFVRYEDFLRARAALSDTSPTEGEAAADVERVARTLWIFEHEATIVDVALVWDAPEKTKHASYWVQRMEANRPCYLEKARVVLASLRSQPDTVKP